jgi:hypothetical protein
MPLDWARGSLRSMLVDAMDDDPRVPLRGRARECAALDALLETARAGESGTLLLRGEAGIGKTALLEYAAMRSDGCRVVRAVGVESELELPFAAVHQLSTPLLDACERLLHHSATLSKRPSAWARRRRRTSTVVVFDTANPDFYLAHYDVEHDPSRTGTASGF